MNIAFTALTLVSIVLLIISSPATAFPTMLQGVMNAITLIIKLTAIYAVWLSVLKMMQATSLDKKLSKLLHPIIKRLFKNESEETYSWISVNLAGNMLGMGGVATPAGIKAMNSMAKDNQIVASANMILLLIINATSIQIIPATVIAIRMSAGSLDASSILAPTLISTSISTLSGIIICKVLALKDNKNDDVKEGKNNSPNSDNNNKKFTTQFRNNGSLYKQKHYIKHRFNKIKHISHKEDISR